MPFGFKILSSLLLGVGVFSSVGAIKTVDPTTLISDSDLQVMQVLSADHLSVSTSVSKDYLEVSYFSEIGLSDEAFVEFIFNDESGGEIAKQKIAIDDLLAHEIFVQAFDNINSANSVIVRVLDEKQKVLSSGSAVFDYTENEDLVTKSEVLISPAQILETDSDLIISGTLEGTTDSKILSVELQYINFDTGEVYEKAMKSSVSLGRKTPYQFKLSLDEIPTGVYDYNLWVESESQKKVSTLRQGKFFVPGVFVAVNSAVSKINTETNQLDLSIQGRTNNEGPFLWELLTKDRTSNLSGLVERESGGKFTIELENIDLEKNNETLVIYKGDDEIFSKSLSLLLEEKPATLSLSSLFDLIDLEKKEEIEAYEAQEKERLELAVTQEKKANSNLVIENGAQKKESVLGYK